MTVTRLLSIVFVAATLARAAEPPRPAQSQPTRNSTAAKKLIEFGWDEPDPAFMRAHAEEMDRSPFDGCVFHVNYKRPDGKTGSFTWEGWGKQTFDAADLQEAATDLKAAPLKRCRDNFLRFNTTPADIDWFDDHTAAMSNAKLAAQFARQSGYPGLLFDIEQYNAPLFNYRKQRDAATKSWDQYATQVRLRGREVMQAFQAGYPDLKVFLTFGYCLPWAQSDNGKKPLADCEYGLLAPFMDGLVEAAKGQTQLIDGVELAYGYRKDADFAAGRKMVLKDLLPLVADPQQYGRRISVSYGLWIDYDWRNKGWNADDASRNPITPELLESLVRSGLQHADEYVWIYTETPRWWSAEGKSVKLAAAYDTAVRAARRPATRPQ